ncbi:MAG: hypothetical protein CL715_03350 [Chloroflexi bacterium]|jgi:hypothetical protein|nr:hypothetical protein [Chloroflexota bacterium]|tara:strand:- start:117 stop:359 length:243 start_codon:yes stop_codon:yes gene_type:complete
MFFKDKSSITHHSFDSMYKIYKKKNINIYEKLYKKHNYFDSVSFKEDVQHNILSEGIHHGDCTPQENHFTNRIVPGFTKI